jgi:ketosteroid isomerase-like protein
MSQETLEAFARQLVEAFNRGLDDYIALHAPDVVHVTAPEWPEGGTYRGKDAVRDLWAGMFAAQEYRAELDDVVVLKDGRVLSTFRVHTTGIASGVATTTVVYSVGTERGGLLARIEYYIDHDRALEAAGLPKSGS